MIDQPHIPAIVDQNVQVIAIVVGDELIENCHSRHLTVPEISVRGLETVVDPRAISQGVSPARLLPTLIRHRSFSRNWGGTISSPSNELRS